MHHVLLLAVLQGGPESSDPRELIRSAIQVTKDSRSEMERQKIVYVKTRTMLNLRESPPAVTDTRYWNMWYRDGASWQRLYEVNGTELADEPLENPGPDAAEYLPERFDYAWAHPIVQDVDGHPCYAISFRPRRSGPKPQSREELVLSRMAGMVYVDRDKGFIRRLEGELPEPFRHKLVSKVNSVVFRFRQRLQNDLVVFDEMVLEINYAVLGFEFHERYTYSYHNYRPDEER